MEAKIIELNGESAVIIPDEILRKLGWKDEDTVNFTQLENSFIVNREDQPLTGDLELAEQIIDEDQDSLRKLADN